MNKQIIKIVFIALATFLFVAGLPEVMEAQCPMCRIAAESNLKNGGTAGSGLNAGILYMLATPYLVIGTIGFIWWKNNRTKKEQE